MGIDGTSMLQQVEGSTIVAYTLLADGLQEEVIKAFLIIAGIVSCSTATALTCFFLRAKDGKVAVPSNRATIPKAIYLALIFTLIVSS